MKEAELRELVRSSRRGKNLTQEDLARKVGCKQPQICSYEQGQKGILSTEKLRRVLEELEIDVALLEERDAATGKGRKRRALGICRNQLCDSNVPHLTGPHRVSLTPSPVEATAGRTLWCTTCGAALEDKCPNEECGAEINPGAYCLACGTRYVPELGDLTGDIEEWIRERRRSIRELREMTAIRPLKLTPSR